MEGKEGSSFTLTLKGAGGGNRGEGATRKRVWDLSPEHVLPIRVGDERKRCHAYEGLLLSVAGPG